VLDDIKNDFDPTRIEYLWQEPLMKFREMRAKYLIYGEAALPQGSN
jgi:hypothetical protein